VENIIIDTEPPSEKIFPLKLFLVELFTKIGKMKRLQSLFIYTG